MSRANIGWLFYKEMYKKGNDDNHIKNTMSRLLDVKGIDESMEAKQSFTLDTLYPGLLIGSGYTHGLSSDYDAKIGFYFDHTTGLPLMQGSSVKGMLRSCFGLAVKGQNDKYENEKYELINSLLKREVDVKALANEIFEGLDHEEKPMSIYNRDIFYEARVVRVKKELLSDDYITPHGGDPFKNPTPLRFIKVAPEVTFEFSFDLKDSQILDISADEKEMLFLELLQEFGVGAKTNVGYGQLELILTEEEKAQRDKEEAERKEKEKEQKLELEKKAKEEAQRNRDIEQKVLQEEKEKKKEEGLIALLDCKTLAEGFKLLKDSFGKKPNPSNEEKEIIEKFKKMQKKLSKGDIKVFSKYGV